MSRFICVDNSNTPYTFKVKDADFECDFEYKPSVEGLWDNIDISNFIIVELENPYLTLESDIYSVNINGIDGTCGWVFPIVVTDSENTEAKQNLLNYVYVAFQYLIENIDSSKYNNDGLLNYYADGEDEDRLILMVLNKKFIISEMPGFDINDYLLSLYLNGYSKYNTSNKALKVDEYESNIKLYNKSKIKLFKTQSESIRDNNYVKELISSRLVSIDHHLVRFVLLYQIIELLIDIRRNKLIKGTIEDYQNQTIEFNDLKQKLLSGSNEKQLLQLIIQDTNITQYIKDEFVHKCNDLFNAINYSVGHSDICNMLYSFRNKVTHSYRDILPQERLFFQVMNHFELVIIDLLINHKS